MRSKKLLLFVFIFIVVLSTSYLKVNADEADNLPVVVQKLVKPPFVPKHNIVAKGGQKLLRLI